MQVKRGQVRRQGVELPRQGELNNDGLKKARDPQQPEQVDKATDAKKADAPASRDTDALDQHPLARNPYAQGRVAPEDRGRYDRPGLGGLNPIGARIALLTGQAVPKGGQPRQLLDSVAEHAHLKGDIGKMPSGETIPGIQTLFPEMNNPFGARKAATKALEAFTVQRADGGGRMSLMDRMDQVGFSADAKERLVDSFTRFHDSITNHRPFDAGGSDTNWKHICAEGAQVLDACAARGLSKEATEDALLASLFSDAVKFQPTLLTHNIDGAVGAYHCLKEHFDLSKPEDADRLAGILAATREHQIGPPSFMAMIAGLQIGGALKAEGKDVAAPGNEHLQAALDGIKEKMADPMNADFVEVTGSGAARIKFTDAERELLGKIGVDDWHTPHPANDWFDASLAVICGDSLVNYAMPDGVGKIVGISGPGTFFKDPTVFHSMFSCGASYVDAQRVVGDDLKDQYQKGAQYTQKAIGQVGAWLDDQLATGAISFDKASFDDAVHQEKVDVSGLDIKTRGDEVFVYLPGDDPGAVPFVHTPLDYDAGGPDVEMAKLVKRRVADLLREHAQWMPASEREQGSPS